MQGPVNAPEEEEDEEEGLGVAGDEGTDEEATTELGIVLVATVVVVKVVEEDGDGAATGVDDDDDEDKGGEPGLGLEPDPEAQEPVGGAYLPSAASRSTLSPGLGKSTSAPSEVPHPLPILATNMSGYVARLISERAAALRFSTARFLVLVLLLPPVTVMGAQFMYISRLPMRLNQVHAMVYSPGVTPSGTVKVYLLALVPSGLGGRLPPLVVLLGQPPTMEWTTKKCESLVGVLSVVRDTWQEPPPWTAEPLNERVWVEPIGHSLEAPFPL